MKNIPLRNAGSIGTPDARWLIIIAITISSPSYCDCYYDIPLIIIIIMRGQADPVSSLARRIIDWRDDARTRELLYLFWFRLATAPQGSWCMVKRIPIPARLDE